MTTKYEDWLKSMDLRKIVEKPHLKKHRRFHELRRQLMEERDRFALELAQTKERYARAQHILTYRALTPQARAAGQYILERCAAENNWRTRQQREFEQLLDIMASPTALLYLAEEKEREQQELEQRRNKYKEVYIPTKAEEAEFWSAGAGGEDERIEKLRAKARDPAVTKAEAAAFAAKADELARKVMT
jgi:adenine-specific DNA methylase